MGLQGFALEAIGNHGEGGAIALHRLFDLDADHCPESVGLEFRQVTQFGGSQFHADGVTDFADFGPPFRVTALSGFPRHCYQM